MEKELIRLILGGRTELFEELVRKYQNLVYTICFNVLKDSQEAENIAQETFFAAFRSLGSFRGGEIKAWLCRIAMNKSIDSKRKTALRLQREQTLEERLQEPSEDPDFAAMLYARERGEKLRKILSDLPEKYSSVIKARYYSGMRVSEIASEQGLPEKTVETRLYRSKKLIKERWGKHDDG